MKEHYKNEWETYRGQKDQEGDDRTVWNRLDIVQILALSTEAREATVCDIPILYLEDVTELSSVPRSMIVTVLAITVLEASSMMSTHQRCEFSPVLNAEFHPLSIHSIIRRVLSCIERSVSSLANTFDYS